MARRHQARGMSTLLVILGLVAILGGTFTSGFLAGRHWERVRVLTGLAKPQAPEPERARVPARAADPVVPALTFYQELTAPLASPAPRATPKSEPARQRADAPPKPDSPKIEAAAKAAAAIKSETTAKLEAGPKTGAYTVQVAAYTTRAQADGLVTRLAAHGVTADVSETTTASGVRYRVRVGSYPTKDAARDAVARLAADTRLGGFVAVR
jgi:cell division septation protein DedD